jgi:hypothetical protein
MADVGTAVTDFFGTLGRNPVYLLLTVAGVAALLLVIIAHHIHKIRSQEIFVHQAWGANWKGR